MQQCFRTVAFFLVPDRRQERLVSAVEHCELFKRESMIIEEVGVEQN